MAQTSSLTSRIHVSTLPVTRSDAVLVKEPDFGLHRSNHVHLDSEVLLKELLMAIGELSGVGRCGEV